MTRFQYRITQPRFRSRDPPWPSSLRMSIGWRWCQLCGQHTAVRSVFAFGVCFCTSYFCVCVWRVFLCFILLCLRLVCVFILHTYVFTFGVRLYVAYFCICVWCVFLYFVLLWLSLKVCIYVWECVFIFYFYNSYFWACVWCVFSYFILLCLRLMCVFILNAYKEKPNECSNCNIYWICSVTGEPEDNCRHANKEESCTVLHWTPLHRTATNVFVRRWILFPQNQAWARRLRLNQGRHNSVGRARGRTQKPVQYWCTFDFPMRQGTFLPESAVSADSLTASALQPPCASRVHQHLR